ncbi:MAG: hypothetical protein Q8P44_09665, partial [Dehalococcoidia bacterium]|nr:hypothetical protein [Dehalococcoidia bacterium]
DENIQTVCIDETVGRRIARLNGLNLTGSIGVLIRAKQDGFDCSMREAIRRMESHCILYENAPLPVSLPLDGGGRGGGDFHASLCPTRAWGLFESKGCGFCA